MPSDWLVRLLWGHPSVMARYGWFVREVQLDTNQPTNRWDFFGRSVFCFSVQPVWWCCYVFIFLSCFMFGCRYQYNWLTGKTRPEVTYGGCLCIVRIVTLIGTLNPTDYSLCCPPFRLAASVSWCWSWEKEQRAVEVVPGIYAVHWKFSMCTAQLPGPVHTARLGRVCFVCAYLCFACLFVLFDFFVSPFFCVFLGSWVVSLAVLGASVTNLNEPPRGLATSIIMWVRS